MRILSFIDTHDSSVCCVNNGEIEFFCKEERLSRKKRDSFPFKSLETFFNKNKDEVDLILYNTPTYNPYSFAIYENFIQKCFNKKLINFSSLSHHLSHASISFYNSGFSEALVFVIDRNGSVFFINNKTAARESESVYLFKYPAKAQTLQKNFWANSNYENFNLIRENIQKYFKNININLSSSYGIVKVYEAATTLIGQPQLENGKTMGLSSYGNEIVNEELFLNSFPNDEKFSHLGENYDEKVIFKDYESLIVDKVTVENFQFYADKAKLVQQQTQDQILNLIKFYSEKTGIKNICLSGGYGLNVVANNFYIKNLTKDYNFYFEPNCDDSGIPIGSAYYNYRVLSNSNEIIIPKNNFYHYYENSNLSFNDGKFCDINELSDLLQSGKSIAIFDSSPEAGPRALGHRSILFDARNPDTKLIVNKIKKREWYRPFAGVILEDKLDDFFITNGVRSSPYMTINFDCKTHTKKLVPGIIHVDNTCRIQTVNEGFLYNLLLKFYEKTNCPMLLNTSFNLAGEPLIQTKNEALQTLKNSKLDAVYFVDDKKIFFNV